jgi:hypothetical protein
MYPDDYYMIWSITTVTGLVFSNCWPRLIKKLSTSNMEDWHLIICGLFCYNIDKTYTPGSGPISDEELSERWSTKGSLFWYVKEHGIKILEKHRHSYSDSVHKIIAITPEVWSASQSRWFHCVAFLATLRKIRYWACLHAYSPCYFLALLRICEFAYAAL